jgi:hypothetical protein
MKTLNCLEGQSAEVLIKRYLLAALWLPIKKVSHRDRRANHILQAECLSAELNFIRMMRLWLSPLVFDGNNPTVPMEFHNVALTGNPKPL